MAFLKKIILPIMIAFLVITLSLAIVACGHSKDEGNKGEDNHSENQENNGGKDENGGGDISIDPNTLDESTALEFMKKLPEQDSFSYLDENGFTHKIAVNGTEKYVYNEDEYYINNNESVKRITVYGYKNGKPIKSVVIGNEFKWYNTTSTAIDIAYSETHETYASFLNFLKKEEFKKSITENAELKAFIGEDYKNGVWGYKNDDGTVKIYIDLMGDADMFVYQTYLYITIDNKNRIMNYQAGMNMLAGFTPDNYPVSDYNEYIGFDYDFEISSIETPGLASDYEQQIIEPRNGAFPDDFNPQIEVYNNETLNVITLPEPEMKKGYTFDGWFYDKNFVFPIKDNKYQADPKSDYVPVYAKISAPKINLELNGGEIDEDSYKTLENCLTVSDIKYSLEAKKEGYEFVGWYTDSDLTQEIEVDNNTELIANTTYYAKYNKLVKINLIASGLGYKLLPLKVCSGEKILDAIYTEPVKKSFFFEGWYKDSEFKTKVTKDDKIGESDITLYAKFVDAICVTINIAKDYQNYNIPNYINISKTGTIEELRQTLKEKVYDEADIFYKPNSTSQEEFLCWAFSEKGGEIDAYPTEDVTVYAVYKSPINIFYQTGTNSPEKYRFSLQSLKANQTNLFNLTEILDNESVYDSDKIIEDWYLDKAYTQVITEETDYSVEGMTIYAKLIDRPSYAFYGVDDWYDSNEKGFYSVYVDNYDGTKSLNGYENLYCFLGNENMLSYKDIINDDYDLVFVCPNWSESHRLLFEGWYMDEEYTTRADLYAGIGYEGTVSLYAHYVDDIEIFIKPGTGYSEDDGYQVQFTLYHHDENNNLYIGIIDYLDYLGINGSISLKDYCINNYNQTSSYEEESYSLVNLVGYYSDEACTKEYVFNGIPTEDVELYYKLELAE